MRRFAATSAVLWALLYGGAIAQPPQIPPDMRPSPALAARLKWVHFGIIGGRIVGVSAHAGTSYASSSTTPGKGGSTAASERLSIDIASGVPTLDYELARGAEQIGIKLESGDRLTIRRQRRDTSGGMAMQYRQIPGEPISLDAGDGDQRHVYHAASLWHLLLLEPQLCREQLLPVLELLRPRWRLATAMTTVEEGLLRRAAAHYRPERQQWSDDVVALSGPKYADREAAERRLLTAGQGALAFLQTLDRTKLDAEQRQRIRLLIADLSDDHEDTVDNLVTSLAGDPQAWLALLARDDEAKRRAAAEQLVLLLDRPIDFDPAADLEIRQAQIERLRAALEEPAER